MRGDNSSSSKRIVLRAESDLPLPRVLTYARDVGGFSGWSVGGSSPYGVRDVLKDRHMASVVRAVAKYYLSRLEVPDCQPADRR